MAKDQVQEAPKEEASEGEEVVGGELEEPMDVDPRPALGLRGERVGHEERVRPGELATGRPGTLQIRLVDPAGQGVRVWPRGPKTRGPYGLKTGCQHAVRKWRTG